MSSQSLGYSTLVIQFVTLVLVFLGVFLYVVDIGGIWYESLYGEDVYDLKEVHLAKEDCLPISSKNPLYVPPEKVSEQRSQYYRDLALFVSNNAIPYTDKLAEIYERYYDLIGANGIFDGFAAVSVYMDSKASHALGEFLASKCDEENYLDLVEILACEVNYGASLHGLIWKVIGTTKNEEELYSKSKALCYFRDEEHMSHVAAGCYHGVGHGFYQFVREDFGIAMQMCNQFKDREIAYRCGGGVAMDAYIKADPPPTDNCVDYDMASTCFNNALRKTNKTSAVYDCRELAKRKEMSDNSYIGCVWASARWSTDFSSENNICETFYGSYDDEYGENVYYACYTGLFSSSVFLSDCKEFLGSEKVHTICMWAEEYKYYMDNAYRRDPDAEHLTLFDHTILDLYLDIPCCKY